MSNWLSRVVTGEVMPRVEIEIRPEKPDSKVWRIYPVGEKRALREGRKVLGGEFRRANQEAQRVAQENGFIYRPPISMLNP